MRLSTILLLFFPPCMLAWPLQLDNDPSHAFGRRQDEIVALVDAGTKSEAMDRKADARNPPASDTRNAAEPATTRAPGTERSSSMATREPLKPGAMRFFVYPPVFKEDGYLGIWTQRLYQAMERSKRKTTDPAAASIFFLGVETACEINWPHYTHQPATVDFVIGDFRHCTKSRKARQYKFLQEHSPHLPKGALKGAVDPNTGQAKLPWGAARKQHIIFDMQGYTMIDPRLQNAGQVVFTAPSFDHRYGFRYDLDIGWPSMSVVDFAGKRQPIDEQCTKPPKYLLTFKGTDDWWARHKVGSLNNGKDVRIVLTRFKANCMQRKDESHKKSKVSSTTACGGGEFSDLMVNTTFGLVIRGDNLYSYRFLETLSAGTIPVILSDGWTLPFHEVIDYSKFAIVLREKQWDQILPKIRAIPAAQVCAMRHEVRRVYDKHFSSFDAQLETFMTVFEAREKKKTFVMPIDWRHEE